MNMSVYRIPKQGSHSTRQFTTRKTSIKLKIGRFCQLIKGISYTVKNDGQITDPINDVDRRQIGG